MGVFADVLVDDDVVVVVVCVAAGTKTTKQVRITMEMTKAWRVVIFNYHNFIHISNDDLNLRVTAFQVPKEATFQLITFWLSMLECLTKTVLLQ